MSEIDLLETPYFEKAVECPICGRESTHYYLKDRMYIVEELDGDSFLKKYRWAKPEFSQFEPYAFYFWHCVHCKFTEERNDFIQRTHQSGMYEDHLKSTFLKKYQEDETIFLLSRFIKYPLPDYYSNLSLHILAIYIQMMPVDYQRNLEKIARYYHRTSWIFRLEKIENRREAKEILFNEFIGRFDKIQADYINMLSHVEELNHWFEQQIRFENEKNISEWSSEKERLMKIYSGMTKNLDRFLSGLQAYNTIGLNYKLKIEEDDSGQRQEYHEYKNYVDYLVSIKNVWPEVPMNEYMSIQKAIHHYRSIINFQILDDQKKKLFQIYRLIIHLFGRMNNFEEAYVYSSQLMNMAHQHKIAAQKRLRRVEKVEDEDVDVLTLEKAFKKSSEMLEFAKMAREKYHSLWVDEQIQNANRLITLNPNLSKDEMIILMEKEKISQAIINKFLKDKDKDKRKGLFQFFKS